MTSQSLGRRNIVLVETTELNRTPDPDAGRCTRSHFQPQAFPSQSFHCSILTDFRHYGAYRVAGYVTFRAQRL